MFRSLKPSTIAMMGVAAIAVLTNCANPETQGLDSQGLDGTGEEAPIGTVIEDRALESQQDAGALEVGTLLRGQQTHYLINGTFADTVADLEIPVSTDSFDFQLNDLDEENHVIVAQPKQGELIAYAGGIHVGTELSQSEAMITCAAEAGAEITPPIWADGKWTCGPGTSPTK